MNENNNRKKPHNFDNNANNDSTRQCHMSAPPPTHTIHGTKVQMDKCLRQLADQQAQTQQEQQAQQAHQLHSAPRSIPLAPRVRNLSVPHCSLARASSRPSRRELELAPIAPRSNELAIIATRA